MNPLAKWGLVIVGTMLALSIVVPMLAPSPQESARRAKAKEVEAKYYTALSTIRKNLKSPSAAKFSNYQTDKSTGARSLGGGVWQAAGSVEAQNSFGATVKSRWELIWRDGGEILYMRIGDQKAGDKESALKAGSSQ